MGRQQLRLLLCSIAVLALMLSSMFGMGWFSANLGFGPVIKLDLRHARMCQDGICAYVPMGKLGGFYPIAAGIAFWTALPAVLLLTFQTGARVFSGAANDLFTKLGYFLGGTAFMFGFAAGFLFGPESQSLGGEMNVVVTVERTIAPALFVIGSLLAMIGLRLAVAEATTYDNAAEYKPIVVRKDLQTGRLPVTPLTGVKTVKPPTEVPTLARAKTRSSSPSIPRSGSTTSPPGRAALPDSLPFDDSFSAPPDLDRELPGTAPRSEDADRPTARDLDPRQATVATAGRPRERANEVADRTEASCEPERDRAREIADWTTSSESERDRARAHAVEGTDLRGRSRRRQPTRPYDRSRAAARTHLLVGSRRRRGTPQRCCRRSDRERLGQASPARRRTNAARRDRRCPRVGPAHSQASADRW